MSNIRLCKIIRPVPTGGQVCLQIDSQKGLLALLKHLTSKQEINAATKPEDDDASENAPSHNSLVDLNLWRPLLLACERLGFTKPSPLQAACLPLAMAGRDICCIASTGSGKTAAFALPTLQRLLIRPKPEQVPGIRVLVLTPTTERGLQVVSLIFSWYIEDQLTN